jgi:hypothetical protein
LMNNLTWWFRLYATTKLFLRCTVTFYLKRVWNTIFAVSSSSYGKINKTLHITKHFVDIWTPIGAHLKHSGPRYYESFRNAFFRYCAVYYYWLWIIFRMTMNKTREFVLTVNISQRLFWMKSGIL